MSIFPNTTGDHIEFPEVITNVGGGYNAQQHEFICPTSGIYLFSTSLVSGWDILNGISIVVDGNRMIWPWTDGRSGNQRGQGTAVLMVECQQGQKVWVECQSDTCIIWDNQDNYCTFSGTLLHSLE